MLYGCVDRIQEVFKAMNRRLPRKCLKLSGILLIFLLGLTLTGCTMAQQGALVGGGIGAGTGALIGHAVGHSGPGALIGGAIGALSGALIGDAVEHDRAYYDDDYPPPAAAPRPRGSPLLLLRLSPAAAGDHLRGPISPLSPPLSLLRPVVFA